MLELELIELRTWSSKLADVADEMRSELQAELALADNLITWTIEHRNTYMGQVPHTNCECGDCQILPILDADIAAWKKARHKGN